MKLETIAGQIETESPCGSDLMFKGLFIVEDKIEGLLSNGRGIIQFIVDRKSLRRFNGQGLIPPNNLEPPFDYQFIDSLFLLFDACLLNHFAELLKKEDLKKTLKGIAIACIGPVTARTVKRWGMKVQIQPRKYTIPGLTQAIAIYFSNK
jgi:hypothetical protein